MTKNTRANPKQYMRNNDKIIERDILIDKLQPFQKKDVIKVITGQRRVGKSYFLKQIQSEFKPPLISINKELYEFDHIKTYADLIEFVESKPHQNQMGLFLDEIQDIEEFEKALRHFQATGNYDIYCTGSNAKLLSGELATLLSGRYIQFEVHSLSFTEFKKFQNSESFDDYLIYGGMPYLKNLPLQQEIVYEYLKSVYQSIILKDVVKRYSLRNVKFLESLVKYLCNNIGSVTSANNISQFLKNQRTKITVTTVMNYLEALKSSYFIYEVPRYDISGKKLFEINSKYYFEDIGIRNSIIGYNQARDEGKLLENVVYLELIKKGYQVYIGVIQNKEIDFIAEKNNEKIYVQVALEVSRKETLEREFGNLKLIKDNYSKYVVTKESNSTNSIEGIKHLSLKDFIECI